MLLPPLVLLALRRWRGVLVYWYFTTRLLYYYTLVKLGDGCCNASNAKSKQSVQYSIALLE